MTDQRKLRKIFDVDDASNTEELLEIVERLAKVAKEKSAESAKSFRYTDAVQVCKIASKAYSRATELVVENPSKFPELKTSVLNYFRETANQWDRNREMYSREGIEKYRKDARTLLDDKRYSEALPVLNMALALDPKNSEVLYETGWALYNIGDTKDALDQFEKAIHENPKLEEAYLAKGSAAFHTGQYEIAEGAYQEATKLDESSAYAWNGLGAVLAMKKNPDFQNARIYIEKAVKLQPDSTLFNANLAEVMLFLKEYCESEKLASWVKDKTSDAEEGFTMRLLLVLSRYLRGDLEKGFEAAEDIMKYSKTISKFENRENWNFDNLLEPVNQSNLEPKVKAALVFFISIPKLSDDQIEDGFNSIKEGIALIKPPESIPLSFLKKLVTSAKSAVGEKPIGEEDIIIKNTAQPDPNKSGYYDWQIFLDNTKEVLSQIKEVKYTLHKTFAKREIIKNNVDERFRLEQNGWGEFNVKVEIILKDGRIITKYHWLILAGLESRRTAA